MRTCFVPLCDAKNKYQPNRTMFSVPKNSSLFAQWVLNLPHVKQLRQSDRICYLHFRSEDIEYTFNHIINGKIYEIQRDRPRLKPNAVPCLEMTTKEELLSYRVKSREAKITKMPDQSLNQQVYEPISETQQLEIEKEEELNENVLPEKQINNINIAIEDTNEAYDSIRANEQTETITESNNQLDLIIEESNDISNDNNTINHEDNSAILNVFNLLYDNICEVIIPNTLWGYHRCPNRSALCFSYLDITKMQITKTIKITSNGSVLLFANAFLINMVQLVKDIDDLDKLSILINQVNLWRFCFGHSTNENCEIVVKPDDENCGNADENEVVYICRTCTQIR